MSRRSCLIALLVGCASFVAPARAAVLPDLVVTAISAPVSAEAGTAITVGTTVKNLQGRAGSSYVRVVLSKDKLVGSTDKVLGKRYVPGLAAGATSKGSKTWTIPATASAGAWYLVACADATKLVKEAREGNNCRARAITVTRNRAPVPVADDGFSTDEDVPVQIAAAALLANDTDPDGNPLSVTAVGTPSNGSVSFLDGTVTFTPTANFHGPAGFSYTVSDGKLPATGQVAVTVSPVNDAPVAVDDEASTVEDTSVLIPYSVLTANDQDVDQDDLTVTLVGSASQGAVALEPGSSGVRFTPSAGFHGAAGFSYTVSDGSTTDVGAVSVTVTPGPLGILTQQESGSITENGYASVWVHLSDPPEQDVTVTPSSPDGKLWPTVSSLTFTPANWNTPQEVVVHAEHDDDVVDGGGVLDLAAPGLQTVQVTWTIDDDDTQALITNTPSVTLGEAGNATFSVKLAFQPASDTTVAVGSGDAGAATASPGSIVFTTSNWATPQTVTVNGVADEDLANEAVAIGLTAAGINAASVTATVTDDDTQGISVSASTVAVTEGSTNTFGVRLRYQPAGTVIVGVLSGNTAVATVSTGELTFTPSNWNIEQNVTVTGTPDVNLVAGSTTVQLSSAGVTPTSVSVLVTDDDTQAVHASSTSKSIREGTQTTVDITLSYQPVSTTTVTCSASPVGSVGVSPSTMTFTPANYANPQSLTLTGLVDGDQSDDEANVTCSATGATSAIIHVWVVEIV